MSLNTDNPLELEWWPEELLGTISPADSTWKITSRETSGNQCHDLEATGTYSCGELVAVEDIEITDTEVIGREPEEME